MSGTCPYPGDVRDHFDHDGPVVIINTGRRSTAAWVRERWDDHPMGSEAVVWSREFVAIACSEDVKERVLEEAPEHWVEHAEGVKASA